MDCWYVVHSKPRQETTARTHLENQAYRCWLPQAVVTRRRGERWVERVEPLFPRYLFLRADVDVEDVSPIRSTRGCAGLVRTAGRPAVVPDAVVDWLRARADAESCCIPLGPRLGERLAPGDRVEVLEGPFAGLAGVLRTLRGSERALVLLELLHRETSVALPTAQLRRVGS
jgi:transcriptional antiterminator RfaH